MDAISLLKEDHRKVEKLFKEIEKAPANKRDDLFKEIKLELTVHTQLEEKLLYPSAEKARPTHELALESVEEHKQVDKVLADLAATDKKTDTWMAGLTVLKEDILHHVEEEESELFPKIEKDVMSEEQLVELGRQMQELKSELMASVKG
jgi:hemerythrin superfamily protein